MVITSISYAADYDHHIGGYEKKMRGFIRMKIYREIPLTEFDFRAGARDTIKYLTDEELDQIEQILEEIYPEGLNEIELNDLFWFEEDLIAEWLGYENFEEIMEREE